MPGSSVGRGRSWLSLACLGLFAVPLTLRSAGAATAAPVAIATSSVTAAQLRCGERLTPLSGYKHSARLFHLAVPEASRLLRVRIEGGEGDADLYLRQGVPPRLDLFDWRPYVWGNHEEVRIQNPSPGDWYVLLHGYQDYTDVTLTARCHHGADESLPHEAVSPLDFELAMYYDLSERQRQQALWSSEMRMVALREEGRIAFNAGDFEHATTVWRRWAELDPTNSDPVSLIGDIHLRQGDLETAIAYYRRSLDIQPGRIALALRLARLLDVEAESPSAARDLLNLYNLFFPNHADVALAQAEWLLRRKRYDEGTERIETVIAHDPENFMARALLHGMLKTPTERYENMRAMLQMGDQPGYERLLGKAILDNHLWILPEAWALMGFVDRMHLEAKDDDLRRFFERLMPRETVAVEDFRIGRLTRNWVSSREQMWNEEGSLILSTDTTQTEAYLRLEGSDALHNGFVEATIEAARGYFWLYARRGEGNMIRFGFDEEGQMYLQVWMEGQLLSNETRLWTMSDDALKLRLEIRADGAFAWVDERPVFSAPLPIPAEMGLGWWGVAPWAPDPGRAAVTVKRIAGGPRPVVIGLTGSAAHARGRTPCERALLRQLAPALSALASDDYRQTTDGRIERRCPEPDFELRLLADYYRMRLLPVVHVADLETLDWAALRVIADRDRLHGFTLRVERMPSPEWIERATLRVVESGRAIHLLLVEPGERRALFRELAPGVGLFAGSRHTHRLPVRRFEQVPDEGIPVFYENQFVMLECDEAVP